MLTVIGDVHGKFEAYHELTKRNKYTFQLGDFGYSNTLQKFSLLVDPIYHKFGQGNHDQHDQLKYTKGFIGRYGSFSHGISFFWVGGAYSIDMHLRTVNQRKGEPPTWFPEEQLSFVESQLCFDEYLREKPEVVISHECPNFVNIGDPMMTAAFGLPSNFASYTAQFLTSLFRVHKPEMWIFGHHHRSWTKKIDGCEFRCLNELETINVF